MGLDGDSDNAGGGSSIEADGGSIGCVWINGRLTAPSQARISVFDHGFLYGDSVFESLRTYQGVPFRLDAHLDRLLESLRAVGIDPDATGSSATASALRHAVAETLRSASLTEAYVRITVSRGPATIGSRGSFTEPRGVAPLPTVIVAAMPLPPYPPERYSHGVGAITLWERASRQRPGRHVKSGSYQGAVIGRREAMTHDAAEGLYLDVDGNVTEGTASNVFAIVDGSLWTPPTTECLAGITRQAVLELAPRVLGHPAVERPMPHAALAGAVEAFLTSSLAEITPLVRLDGTPIGSGIPGSRTQRLAEAYHQATTHFAACDQDRWRAQES